MEGSLLGSHDPTPDEQQQPGLSVQALKSAWLTPVAGLLGSCEFPWGQLGCCACHCCQWQLTSWSYIACCRTVGANQTVLHVGVRLAFGAMDLR